MNSTQPIAHYASAVAQQLHVDDSLLTTSEYLAILDLQQSILEMVAVGQEDDAILAKLCKMEEQLVPNAVASIMMLDEKHQLNVRSAPSVPPEGVAQLNGLTPGPGGGSCGNAVYRNEPVFVSNTLTDDRWADLRHVAVNFGLCACWSMPVRTIGKEVIGSFALSSFEHREPNLFQTRLLEIGAFVVSIVTRRREQEQLIQQQMQRLQLSAKAFNSATEGILISDKDNRIIEVNPSLCRIFGYSETEILGNRPSLFSSGRHPTDFYKALWTTLEAEGQWSGEIWNRKKSGDVVPLWVSISRLYSENSANYLAVYSDMSELHQTQQKLAHMAYHDSLTGLYNRSYLYEQLEQLILANMREKRQLAVLFLDLDRFKNLNDTFGHLTGDKILIQVGQRIKDALEPSDLCARIGGDEFVVVLNHISSRELVEKRATKILASLQAPFSHNRQDFLLGGSIGISLFPQDANSAEHLLKCADTAMYFAKKHLRDNISFYVPEQGEQSSQVFLIENDLHKALDNQELMLYFQPKISADNEQVIGAEALIRWRHPQKGMIPPNQFIPIAEETGMIISIGEWVLQSALQTLQRLRDSGFDQLSVSVNLSGRQVNHVDIERIIAILRQSAVPRQLIELELTETFLMQNPETAAELVEQLHQEGVRLSIDDFGSGYSSLSYLKRFHVHCLKIDQLLIRDIVNSSHDLAIAKAVVALGHSLDLHVIAEGVETEQQKQLLQQTQCDAFQGYYYAKPMPEQEFFAYLQQQALSS